MLATDLAPRVLADRISMRGWTASSAATTAGYAGAPDLSVVIPMRNARDTVGTLLRDLLAVPGVDLEVIVVDDASSDDSAERVDQVAGDAVQVIRLDQRHGAGHARNVGFAHASGRYTLFFDADDEIHPQALRSAMAMLEDTRADVAFLPYRYRRGHSEYEGMNDYDRSVWAQYAPRQGEALTLDEVPRLLGFSNYPWNKIVRTDR